ncbi:ExbD/TolR family protein [Pseudochelatococcus contaminans]|uniref:Biopolymer transport protein TolR n=1 Tax=Pseudochelatococcus contaminans TaxID=1538103 RepID=A0A7W5Z3B9_9HYPH|nr:biopolymer transporter ExbD [Pseudochelatococcus contaminans]MBB3809055.1 biopolymer transport protein TolR [Pseudochelatococcus contaminans]
MGMSVGGAGSGAGRGGRRRGRAPGVISEINMTPFIDVMLVLLIIFMVAAPMMVVGVPLDLPQTAAKPLNMEQKPLTVSVSADGRVYVLDTELSDGAIVERLREVAPAGEEERIYVRGAKAVNYGRVAEVMALITAAGFKKVALVTEPDPKLAAGSN